MTIFLIIIAILIGVIMLLLIWNNKLMTYNIELKTNLKFNKEAFQKYKEDKNNLEILFQNISNNIIQKQNKSVSDENKQSLENVLNPFKEKLNYFQQSIESLRNQTISSKASFDEQFITLLNLNKNLSEDAKNLTDALKNNKKLQGNWGEFQLEQILELSGLQKGVNYLTQDNLKTEDGKDIRPDFIVNLPDKRAIIIDSKVSLNDYLEYMKSDDEIQKKIYLKNHASCIKSHMNSLSKKHYQRYLQKKYNVSSVDYVVMFLPYESAYVDAIRTDKDIYSLMAETRVVIATPSSLFPILKTVENLWQLDRQNDNVIKIAEIGGALYDKFVSFNEDMQKIEKDIDSVHNSYRTAYDRLNSPRGAIHLASKLKDLGANTTKTLGKPKTIDD